MKTTELDIATAFARRLRANAAHAEARKFSVANLSTLPVDDCRALAGFIEGAHARGAPAEPVAWWKCTGCGEVMELRPTDAPAPAQEPVAVPAGFDDWREDPSADERWNAGCDYALEQLCAVLNVAPESIQWDAATETVDGDVQAVLRNILDASLGEDWRDMPVAPVSPPVDSEDVERLREALKHILAGKVIRDPHDPTSTIVASLDGDEIDAICETALASAPAPQPGGAVKVKALKWKRTGGGKDWEAASTVGVYAVGDVHGAWMALLRRADADEGLQDKRIRSCRSEKAAKAAAQADYEQRILAALAPTPSTDFAKGAEVMREVLRTAADRLDLAAFELPLGSMRRAKILEWAGEVRAALALHTLDPQPGAAEATKEACAAYHDRAAAQWRLAGSAGMARIHERHAKSIRALPLPTLAGEG